MKPEVREWFLNFHAMQAKRLNWACAESWRSAQPMCPNLCADFHVDTPLKWHLATGGKNPGRPTKLEPAALTLFANICAKVCGTVAMSSGVSLAIFQDQAENWPDSRAGRLIREEADDALGLHAQEKRRGRP